MYVNVYTYMLYFEFSLFNIERVTVRFYSFYEYKFWKNWNVLPAEMKSLNFITRLLYYSSAFHYLQIFFFIFLSYLS